MNKLCIDCGDEMVGIFGNKRYCDLCSTLECTVCGTKFSNKNHHARRNNDVILCCNECKRTWFKDNIKPPSRVGCSQVAWSKGLILGGIDYECDMCKKITHFKTFQFNHTKRHFCSQLCSAHFYFGDGTKTSANKKIRLDKRFNEWRGLVFMRDNWTCQTCGIRGTELHPHHIKQLSVYPELAYELDNGVTLCKNCHMKTETWGKRTKQTASSWNTEFLK